MRFLSTEQYDAVLLQTLRRCGLDDQAARRLIAARWPMTLKAFLLELDVRGLHVDPVAAREWLVEVVGERWPDGAAIRLDETFISESLSKKFVEWIVSNGKARPSDIGRLLQTDPRPARMLVSLGKAQEN